MRQNPLFEQLAKKCQTEISQSEQKLTILGNTELQFLNVNKS